MMHTERLLKALADKNRLRIIHLLTIKRMCVCELAFVIGITQPSVSRHLKKLLSAGVIASEQDRLWTNYYLRVEDQRLQAMLSCLKRCFREESEFKHDSGQLNKADRGKLCCREMKGGGRNYGKRKAYRRKEKRILE
jgi:ArsR family transcriptional regulator